MQATHVVGQVYRVRLPFRGVVRTVLVWVMRAHRDALRVRVLPMLALHQTTMWVPAPELDFLQRIGLAERVTTLPCTCGGTMHYHWDGLIDDRPHPFFACDACERCVAV